MPTIATLGALHRRTCFEYDGSVAGGATIYFKKAPPSSVTAAFFQAIFRHYKGQTVAGGFSMTDPTPGGFGE